MSSRIRVVAKHPDFGILTNRLALATIEREFNSFRAAYPLNAAILPVDFQGWSRWKRCAWKANEIGWKFKAFREPRNTRVARSAFWKATAQLGGRIPRRKKLTLKVKWEQTQFQAQPVNPEAWPEQEVIVGGL